MFGWFRTPAAFASLEVERRVSLGRGAGQQDLGERLGRRRAVLLLLRHGLEAELGEHNLEPQRHFARPAIGQRRGAAALVTIDRQHRRNAVDGPTAELLHESYLRFEADDDARVMVLTGAGGVSFRRFSAAETAFAPENGGLPVTDS